MFGRLIQTAITSIGSLWANKMRSLVTMLGIIIGVGSVVLIMSIGAGAQSLILSQIESIGGNALMVLPGHSESDNPLDALTNFAVTTLKYEDIEYLENHKGAPFLTFIAGYTKGFASVKWRSESYDTSITGTTESYLAVEKGEVDTGRFFTKEEEKNLSRVVVLGSDVKDGLFGDSDAVGQRVKIKDVSYEVIGVLKERGSQGIENPDDQVLMPIKSAQRLLGVNNLGFMRMRVDTDENVKATIQDVKVLLRESHDIRDQTGKSDDFSVNSSAQAIGIVTALTDSVAYFLTAMAAISLVVGGIGIMNVMLISVTERTREIGLRKAVGASNSAIMEQFLIESVFITGIGGLIGVIGGVFLAFVISFGVQFAGFDWQFIVPPSAILLALAVSTFVGLVFGFYPARKASKLDPIEALQYE